MNRTSVSVSMTLLFETLSTLNQMHLGLIGCNAKEEGLILQDFASKLEGSRYSTQPPRIFNTFSAACLWPLLAASI